MVEDNKYITNDNVVSVTVGFWPTSLNLASVDPLIVSWYNRIIKFNLEAEFLGIRAEAKKGRNLLHVHPDHPGFDVVIYSSYRFDGQDLEFEYKYKNNSHYVSVRNKLSPINLNAAWSIVNGSKANKRAFQALDEAFKTSFCSLSQRHGYHRGYGIGSDIFSAIQSDAFKEECLKAISKQAGRSNVVKYGFKKSLASLDIDYLSDDELLQIMKSAACISHILLKHKWSPERMLEFLRKASMNVVDASQLNNDDIAEIRAIRSIKMTHS